MRSGELRRLVMLWALVGCSEAKDPPVEPNRLDFKVEAPLEGGEENWLCSYVQLPQSDAKKIYLSGSSHRSTLAHHFGLYRTRLKELPKGAKLGAPAPCWEGGQNAMQYVTSFILLEQTPTSDLSFPESTALAFTPGEILVVQTHGVNPQSASAKVTVDFSLTTIAPEEVTHEMGLLQFFAPFIYLPPKSRAKAGVRCLIPNDLTLLEGNAHYHLRGREFNAFIDPPGEPPARDPFLVSHDWQHPTKMTDPIEISAGSHIRVSCDYDNREDRVLTQGQSKNDNEMCSFWGYAYPAPKDDFALTCVGPYADQVGVGQATCAETAECLSSCPVAESPDFSVPGVLTVGPCFQKCMVDSCPNVSALLDRQQGCIAYECAGECPGEECESCREERCGAAVRACRDAACE